jgi:hypothetical protein
MKKSRDLLMCHRPLPLVQSSSSRSVHGRTRQMRSRGHDHLLDVMYIERRPLRDAPCGPSRPNPIARRQAQGFSKCVTEAHQGCRRKLSVRSDYRKSACSVFCDVCFALQNGLKSGIARCMKSANNRHGDRSSPTRPSWRKAVQWGFSIPNQMMADDATINGFDFGR